MQFEMCALPSGSCGSWIHSTNSSVVQGFGRLILPPLQMVFLTYEVNDFGR